MIFRGRFLESQMDALPPPRNVRAVALLIWILSRKADLAMCYVLSRGKTYDLDGCDLSDSARVVLFLAEWLRDEKLRHSLHAGLASLEVRDRIAADVFLVRSLLISYIIQQNANGLTVDLSHAIFKYVKLWSYRPTSERVRARLSRLIWHRNSRRKFGVELRKEWDLTINVFETARELPAHAIRRQVPVNNPGGRCSNILVFSFTQSLY